jgi:predicted Ser/Thr protein kinase
LAARIYGKRWKTKGSLGEGGQSHVFEVTDDAGILPGKWALKRLRQADRVDRFKQEVEILKQLNHDNVIKIVDSQILEEESEGSSYLVMPLAHHRDLEKRLAIYTGQIGSVVEVAIQVARALKCVHAHGIVHRDIKPGNILFPEVGHKVWVADFGISLDQAAVRNTPDGKVMGPRGFTAPELEVGGDVAVAPSVDVFSLGQVIFYMLSGGKKVARENVLDAQYDDIFAGGERHHLLRLLLNRMVVLKERRTSDINEVIVELERIEKWEESAVTLVLGKRARAAITRLQRSSADAVAEKIEKESGMVAELNTLDATTKSVVDWLAAEIEKIGSFAQANRALAVGVVINGEIERRPLQVDTGHQTILEQRGSIVLAIGRPEEDRVEYAVYLMVCSEISFQMKAGDPDRLGPRRDPRLAVFPVLVQHNDQGEHRKTEIAYFLGESVLFGAPSPVPYQRPSHYIHATMDRRFTDGMMSIVRFRASQWPAVKDDIASMVDDICARFVEYILSNRKTIGPAIPY